MSPTPTMSRARARRTILAAQGLADPRPMGRVDRRHFRRVIRRLGLSQIDSVNVLARAHYVPFFSRLGPHDDDLLDRLAYSDHELFEYWGHVASLIDVGHEPDLRWRMEEHHHWRGPDSVVARHPELVTWLEGEVHDQGPIGAGRLREQLGHERRKESWWGWDTVKLALEYLFWSGRVSALRSPTFERLYCHPDDAIPAAVRSRPTPTPADAKRALLTVAARAHGIGTAGDLADYWRLKKTETKPLLDDLVEEGTLERLEVEGWGETAYRHPDARTPRRVDACTLVSPFDVSMWERDRVRRVHDFDYTIEIYVPAPKRVYGYYVLPFLLGDTFVGRVDLKADRRARALLVQSAHAEPDLAARGTDEDEVATRLGGELRAVATWLDLDEIVVAPRGDLAGALRAVAP